MIKKITHIEGVKVSIFDSLKEESKVLDFGCGQGVLSIYLIKLGHNVVSTDIDAKCEQNIKNELTEEEKNRFKFVLADNNKYFQDNVNSFDIIICREVLEHVEDPDFVIKLFSKLLKPDGIIILSVPTAITEYYFNIWDSQWLKKSEHLRIFKRSSIYSLVKDSGLTCFEEEGQSFRWSMFWFLLSPFKVNHIMGNPTSHIRLVNYTLTVTARISSINIINKIGNSIFPKSRFYYIKKRKPRILIVYDYLDWILGKWATNIQRIFSNEFDVVIISMFHAQKDVNYTKKLIKKVDIIHLLLPHPFSFFKEISSDKIVVPTIHHWIDGGEDYDNVIKNSNKIVTGAVAWKNKISERGINHENITVVISGVEERFFQDHSPLVHKNSKLTCGFFAKWDSNESDRKGTRHLLNLARLIKEQSHENKIRFVISGPGWNNIIAELRELNLEIIYFPYTPDVDMPALFQSLDVYLMLSDVEGGPVTIAESMASKSLIFSTNVGVASELIQDNENGCIIDTSNIADILNKLLFFYNNKEKQLLFVKKAYKFAIENLKYDETMLPLKKLYNELFAECKFLGTGKLDTRKENIRTAKGAYQVKA